MTTFADLKLKKELVSILNGMNFKVPSEVQKQVIPLTMSGDHVVFTSRTGSGKTLAYTLGFLSKLNKKLGVQMMVVVPTRELAIQVGKELTKICEVMSINVGVLFGGREIRSDYKTLNKKNQIMVGTPGRLIDHINARTLRLGELKHLIYDESDQMFDNGFYSDCSYIKKRVGVNTQIIMASATITDQVEKFLKYKIKEFHFLQIGDLVPKSIIQEVHRVQIPDKLEYLKKILESHTYRRALIFVNTKTRTYEVPNFLTEKGLKVKALNGDFKQQERQDVLNIFKQGKIKTLITTDVAARGIHIKDVDMVINYDVPTKSEYYVHRIGRTGRNDKKGFSITFLCKEDEERFKLLKEEFELDVVEKKLE